MFKALGVSIGTVEDERELNLENQELQKFIVDKV